MALTRLTLDVFENGATDTITDFNVSENDVLDIADLLEDAGATTDDISIINAGGDTTVRISNFDGFRRVPISCYRVLCGSKAV